MSSSALFSLNIGGTLVEYSRPAVMGIINATPDSFFAGSRAQGAAHVREMAERMLAEGADMIDVGACSTRPGSEPVSADEELRRLDAAMEAVRAVAPGVPVSVDTFRPEVARRAVSEMSADIVNDVSGGCGEMFEAVAELRVPYVLTHNGKGSPVQDVMHELASKAQTLALMGVCDVIVDPGYGFGKTLGENYALLRQLGALRALGLPLLVGLSRKSMITSLLGITADEALCATSMLNFYALQQGASILRVHDPAAARQAVELCAMLSCNEQP